MGIFGGQTTTEIKSEAARVNENDQLKKESAECSDDAKLDENGTPTFGCFGGGIKAFAGEASCPIVEERPEESPASATFSLGCCDDTVMQSSSTITDAACF